jgi:hypothetical protein
LWPPAFASTTAANGERPVSGAKPKALPTPKTAEEILALLRRARKGDEAALPAVRELLKNPEAIDYCGGDIARQAEASLISTAAGKDLAFKEAQARKLELLRAEVAGPNPTPLERLLAARVAACWLQLHYYEAIHAQQAGQLTMTQGEYHQRQIDSAHRRYLAAIKTLAVIRKLAVPVLQVNIAKKQVNVAGPCAGGTD